MKWEIKDQDGNDLACVTLPAQIVDADKKQEKKTEENDTVLRFKSHN